jgi:hypothetical protein
MNYPKPKYSKGVLVYADGRTTALDNVIGAEWWIQGNDLDRDLPKRYFRLADIARMIAEPEHPIWVYTERPAAEYLDRTRA